MAENTYPLVSTIIPVYNGELYLAEAIESALAQTYQPMEIIVVNDGSTDASETVAQSFGSSIRYYAQANKGLGATRNQGIELAQGDFIAFLDADDLWVADKTVQQMAYFDDDPDLEMVFGHVQQFYTPELEAELKKKIRYAEEIMKGIVAGTLLIKRDAFDRVGPFVMDWVLGEFVDWYTKAQEKNLRSSMHPEVVLKRRLHATNSGTRDRDHRTDYVRILKASLDRRRAMDQGNEGQPDTT